MKIAITSDSVCDLSNDLLSKNNIKILSLPITLGDKEFTDSINLTPQEIFDYVQKNKVLPKTSAINEFQYNEFFSENLKSNDALIHFTISSGISSCYVNAVNAAKNFKNVYIIDSRSLSTGVGLQVLYACSLRDKGLKAEEIVEKVDARKKYIQASFVIERLDYLYKGGRCSSLQLLGANLLKIRPSIILKDGKMQMHKKYRGKMPDVVKEYCLDTLKEFNSYDENICFITYSSATPQMIESAKDVLKNNTNFKQFFETTAGCTITSHCGENTLGILYYNNKEV